MRKRLVVLTDEVYVQMITELEDELLKNERSGKIIKQEIADKYDQSFGSMGLLTSINRALVL